MESILIEFHGAVTNERIAALLRTIGNPQITNAGVSLEDGDKRAYIHIVEDDIEELPLGAVVIDYWSTELAKRILLALLSDEPAKRVNLDFGEVLSGDDVLLRIRSDPSWDWMRHH